MPDIYSAHDRVVPKLCGADIELGNIIVGNSSDCWTSASGEAARAILAEIPGHRRKATQTSYAPGYYSSTESAADFGNQASASAGQGAGYYEYAQDRGRKFLPSNSSCVYIDMDFIEICLPEVTNAWDHLAAFGAMLRIVREATSRANERLPSGTIKVLVNNTSGHGKSHGSHLNFLTTRECWNNIFERRLHYLLFLATYQCASIVLTGAGKVGSEMGARSSPYQISARADFFEVLVGSQTTFRRPICNSRDESLTGALSVNHGDSHLARLHCIFFDNTLCHTSSLLKVGMTQIILAMIEQEQVPSLLLEDPVASLHRWSHDPELNAKCRLLDGDEFTAVELLEAIFERAKRFVDSGRADGLVRDSRQIIELWGQCLQKLRQRDFDYLARRIDWIAKWRLLQRTAAERHLNWSSPAMKYLDHMYCSLDSREGLYWALERGGAVQKLVSDGQIERFIHEPPEDTRAWLRAYILKHAAPELVDDVDWDMVRLRVKGISPGGWSTYTYPTLWMTNPLRFTRAECEQVLQAAPTLTDGLRALGLGSELDDASMQPSAKVSPVYGK